MLQIKDICKEYRTGSLVQKALDHVSLNLRNNEFVAILGPSGSGKTTLLNIIGGLDRYDSGDLIINGISTKRYKDRDWDSYRNHTIGFVFQSYNLIPHQTILSNVELALTISGISGSERRIRAAEALEKVGLGDQIHKKPSQLSGGQMQRVAIARALVNDPDILLADEPTGALDSDTSVTIMDLLKEVASDRLVVMVTHNPELAEQYATRIVNLKDGNIIGDSDPFEPENEEEEPMHKNMGKSSMSFLTALSLSFNNLRTKLTRTILVSFAGSIGIIGIALIMSLSNGVNRYIKDVEEETLLQYPLEIQNASVSLSSFIEVPETEEEEEKEKAEVTERRIASTMFSRVSNNDLGALKKYFESDESHIMDYAKAIEYSYNVTPLIYRLENGEARQVNPDTSFSALGFSSSSLVFSSAFNTDVFRALPSDESLYKNSYDLKAGRWAENYNECMLVISSSGRITDTILYTLGLKNADELTRMMEAFSAGETVKEEKGPLQEFSFEDFVGISFKLVNSYEKYVYDGEYDVWTDKSDDKNYINKLAKGGEDLVITGVIQAREDATVAMLMPGIYYPDSLTKHIIEESYRSQITGSQLLHSNIDVFTGKEFNAPRDENDGLNLETLFSVDPKEMSKVFSFDSSKLSMDTSSFENLDMSDMNVEDMIDSSALEKAMPDMSSINFQEILASADLMNNVDYSKLPTILNQLTAGYAGSEYEKTADEFVEAFKKFLDYEDPLGVIKSGKTVIREHVEKMVSRRVEEELEDRITTERMQEFVKTIMAGFPAKVAKYYKDHPGESVSETVIKDLQEEYIAEKYDAIAEAITNLVAEEIKDTSISEEEMNALSLELITEYSKYAFMTESPSIDSVTNSFSDYLRSDAAQAIISNGIASAVNAEQVEKNISKAVAKVTGEITDGITKGITSMMTSFMTKFTEELTKKISVAIQDGMGNMAENMNSAFSIHPEAFAKAISMNMDEQELSELLTSLMSKQPSSYDSNLKLLGYADVKKPYSITIYPRDFEAKSGILNILDSYNERMREEDEDKVITYTDTVGLLMTSVTDIINAISYVLIAFVAISLIVSSIMIGVITYISVLERRKEIGILRAIGASKQNISSVFNAETFIIGLLAGVFGIGITLLLLIPGNMLIHHFTDADVHARLPLAGGAALILLSVVLTMIGGILPSQKAARSDPVAALRTE